MTKRCVYLHYRGHISPPQRCCGFTGWRHYPPQHRGKIQNSLYRNSSYMQCSIYHLMRSLKLDIAHDKNFSNNTFTNFNRFNSPLDNIYSIKLPQSVIEVHRTFTSGCFLFAFESIELSLYSMAFIIYTILAINLICVHCVPLLSS